MFFSNKEEKQYFLNNLSFILTQIYQLLIKKKINLNDVEVVSFDLPGLLNVQSQDGALVSVKGEGGVEWR